jgi:16S rRNA (guanine(966)-N(2))-methyltransferase RsmD
MDRMRESVFAVLGDISGLSFLDLFSGSGSIGLEAASRGADPVVLVERDRRKRSHLLKNAAIAEEEVRVVIAPVERFVKSAVEPFDLIFLDPPFPYPHKADLLERVAASRLVHTDGRFDTIVMIHYPAEEGLPEKAGSMVVVDQRRYGRSLVRIFRGGSTAASDSV